MMLSLKPSLNRLFAFIPVFVLQCARSRLRCQRLRFTAVQKFGVIVIREKAPVFPPVVFIGYRGEVILMRTLSCIAILLFAVVQMNLTAASTNSWTKPTSGNWEEPFWSLGVLPSMNQGAIEFRNPGFKALAIASSTTANFPGSLAIQNLTVDAPAGSANQLLLNYAGVTVPLNVNGDFVLGPNASLVSYYSSLHAQTLWLNGPASFAELSVGSFGTIKMNGGSTFNLANGTVTTTDLDMLASTAFSMTNGVLDTTNLEMVAAGNAGTAEFKSYGGSIRVRDLLRMGRPRFPVSGMVGNFLLAGGRLEVGLHQLTTGRFTQTGGTNLTQALNAPGEGDTDQAEYFLLGGFLGTGQVDLGGFDFGGRGGTFVQSNGSVHANSDFIQLWGMDRTGAHNIKGRYTLAGGLFTCPQIQVIGGAFTQNGGTNRTPNLTISDDGSYYIDGGSLTASNVTVSSRDTRGFYSSYYHQGGTTIVPGTFSLGTAASFTIQLGTFSASNIVVGVGEPLLQGRSRPIFAMPGSGTIVNSNFTLSGGNISGRSQHQLGKLVLGVGASALGFEESGAVLRFLDSHTATWSGSLAIVSWAGSTNGGGGNRLFFGTSVQGLTAAQLSRIYFINPTGLPIGNYPARILATGEVVPAARPSMTFRRSSNQLVLSWPGGYQLYSATNVPGFFTLVTNATSPYTNNLSEPQRYFQLRSSSGSP